MSEQVTPVRPVSTHTLWRAVIRIDSRKHPAAVREIERELVRRKLRRAA